MRDLAKKGLGVDLANNFRPDYVVSPDKTKVVAELKAALKRCDEVYLATDEDREGEAIAWHLAQVLGLDLATTKRIAFHEITKSAVLHALEHPRVIDQALVDAQQARRIMDRLVGFEVSPVLWQKVRSQLSAGRVQSVAVRLIVEREREVVYHEPERFYRVQANFMGQGPIRAQLNADLSEEEEARGFLRTSQSVRFRVGLVEEKPAKRHPAPPFTTSSLQQEASRKCGFSPSNTMRIAQKLYEAGMITYMRTDSVNLSSQALANLAEVVKGEFGEEYHQLRTYSTKSKGAQEAHEAIRPTDAKRATVSLDADAKRLYDLIRKRSLACQMADAQLQRTTAKIEADGLRHHFVAKGEVIVFPGFLKLYVEGTDEEPQEDSNRLPQMVVGEELQVVDMVASEKFSNHPPRYSEASLVKKLDDLGIGRPSTYAATIKTIADRGYVETANRDPKQREVWRMTLSGGELNEDRVMENYGAERRKMFPSDVGIMVTDYLMARFPQLMSYDFTAKVEEEIDEIATGQKDWEGVLHAFYTPFHEVVEKALAEEGFVNTERVLGVDPASGREVLVRMGKYGPLAQIGKPEDEEKVRFASLRSGQFLRTITLEEALELFRLPRAVGEFEGKELVVAIGRFGPYVRHDGQFVSLAKTDDPYTIDEERAVELILAKREDILRRTLRTFPEAPDLLVMKGRWGACLSYKGKMHRFPKETNWEEMSAEELMQFVKESPAKKGTTKKNAAKSAKKAPAKKRSPRKKPKE
ncbi:MAG: DNA topoisomerase I [Bacteroidetes bacterium]|nr:MAG: DNA topoisomerase I [Bacteroidota bacterium]